MSDQTGIVQEFLIESLENLEELDRELVRLEKEPESAESISSIFRTIHTIKGTSSFLGFSKLEALTHKGESLLSRMRDGKLTLTSKTTDALLEMVDAVRIMLTSIESTESDGDEDYAELMELLLRLQGADPVTPAPPKSETTAEIAPESAQQDDQPEAVTHESAHPPSQPASEMVERLAEDEDIDSVHEPLQCTAANSTLRIDVELLDKIMDLVGELVLARNQIVLQAESEHNAELVAKYQRLNHITSDLQECVVKTRMQPIGRIWNTVPRQVRDVAMECGKQVRVELEGKETELDKSIIESIKGPITHLVRNCVDHGLESPEDRVAANKPPEGCVHLSARHESGQVVIEVSDDGRGIDISRIREKALQRDLITTDAADKMTERQWFDMIFEPGFSTAASVTSISGRGVGLDVVKTNIERLAGAIELKSVAGQGTTFFIKIPLTLAIIPALIVEEDGCRYAIPQTNLTELVRLNEDAIERDIEQIYNARVFRLRGELLPLIDLSEVLGTEKEIVAADDSQLCCGQNIVVVDTGQRRFGLVVDQIRDTQEIVIKPLGRALRGLPIYSGATILGDGQLALIMDVAGVAQMCGIANHAKQDNTEDNTEDNTGLSDQETTSWLVVASGNQQKVIDMTNVLRLEEFSRSAIEESNDCPVIQYRGKIMSLINDQHHSSNCGESAGVQVVVVADGDRIAGYVVDHIVDIVVAPNADRDDAMESIVVGKRVSDIVNVPSLLA